MISALIGESNPRWKTWRRVAASWLLAAAFVLPPTGAAFARACVWKVTSGGHTLYLAGSVHALRGADYPLPAAYDQAYQASSVVAFETDLRKIQGPVLQKAMFLPRGSTLRDHLDPRVYAYILRVIANVHGSTTPEKKLEKLRPWAVAWLLQAPNGIDGVESGEGIDAHFLQKAVRTHKEIVGLVPLDEHIAVFGGMNDADSQAYLLLRFIQLDQESKVYQQMVSALKRGDAEAIDQSIRADYRDTPGLRQRIITDRNRRWLPEIAQWLGSGKTYMVIAGAAHMVGSEGVPALLRAQGFQVEQL